tara:strand:+ start:49 stop:375 length:327 start_codon:yes stop_codon:yes gene_type:complete
MAISKKGTRNIVVNDVEYIWKITKKPSYTQELGWSNLQVAIQKKENGLCTLIVDSGHIHSESIGLKEHYSKDRKFKPVTPKLVQDFINQALKNGWNPSKKGSPFNYST